MRILTEPSELMMPKYLPNQMNLNVPSVEKNQDSLQTKAAKEVLPGGVPSVPAVGILGEMIISIQ